MVQFPAITVVVSPRNPGTLVPYATLLEMYATGYNLVLAAGENPNPDWKRFWFGIAGQTYSARIDDSVAKMKAYMNGGLKKMDFNCTGEEGSMMSFNQYAKLKVPGGPSPEVLNKQSQVNVNRGFSNERFSFGEKVGAILHEITHMCIGTADVNYKGRDMYGADFCVELAKDAPDLAITNADNWCYYFTSYHDRIIQSGFDWSGLTPEEVATRRAQH
jgi:Lysine-specific metallo-endopeptidase